MARVLSGGSGRRRFCQNRDPGTRRVCHLVRVVTYTSVSILLHKTSNAKGRRVTTRVRTQDRQGGGPCLTVSYKTVSSRLTTSRFFNRRGKTFANTRDSGIKLFHTIGKKALFLSRVNGLSCGARVLLLETLRRGHYGPVNSAGRCSFSVQLITTAGRGLRGTVKRKHFQRSLFRQLGRFALQVPALTRYQRSVLPLTCFFLGLAYTGTRGSFHNFSQLTRTTLLRCP